MEEGRYWIALFNEDGERAGIERELAPCDRLDVARLKYELWAAMFPERLVMLCDRATILARSDRAERAVEAAQQKQRRPYFLRDWT